MDPLGWFLLSMTPATAINFFAESLHCQLSFELGNIISSFDQSSLKITYYLYRLNVIALLMIQILKLTCLHFGGDGRDF